MQVLSVIVLIFLTGSARVSIRAAMWLFKGFLLVAEGLVFVIGATSVGIRADIGLIMRLIWTSWLVVKVAALRPTTWAVTFLITVVLVVGSLLSLFVEGNGEMMLEH